MTEADRQSVDSHFSLNTANLHSHTSKVKFAVNKNNTVQFYLNTLIGGYENYAEPEIHPQREDTPKAQKKARVPKGKRRREKKANKENDQPSEERSSGEVTSTAKAASILVTAPTGDNEDPLLWFRARDKATVEEEFEEFKKRFVWNGSRMTATPRQSPIPPDGVGDDSKRRLPRSRDDSHQPSPSADSSATVQNSVTRSVSNSESANNVTPGQLSVPAGGTLPRKPQLVSRRSFRGGRAPSGSNGSAGSGKRAEVGIDRSGSSLPPAGVLSVDAPKLTKDSCVQTEETFPTLAQEPSSGSRTSECKHASREGNAVPLDTAAAPAAMGQPFRLPLLAAAVAASSPQSAASAAAEEFQESAASWSAAAIDRTKLSVIRARAKDRLPGGANDDDGSPSFAGELPAIPIKAKVETIKLLAREKRKQRKKQRDAQLTTWYEIDDPERYRRHGGLPALSRLEPADRRCASEVASPRRVAKDYSETESRNCVSEVLPGRVNSLSMNFDAYVRAMEKMVDATLKALTQSEIL